MSNDQSIKRNREEIDQDRLETQLVPTGTVDTCSAVSDDHRWPTIGPINSWRLHDHSHVLGRRCRGLDPPGSFYRGWTLNRKPSSTTFKAWSTNLEITSLNQRTKFKWNSTDPDTWVPSVMYLNLWSQSPISKPEWTISKAQYVN